MTGKGVVYSEKYRNLQQGLRQLPEQVEPILSEFAKKDCLRIKKLFHDGIKNNSLDLVELKDATVARKKRMGFDRPKNPLYGKGDRNMDRSYANLLVLQQVKGGWTLRPSRKMHWSMKITLDYLFMIHEHGCTINRMKADGTSTMITIPPRPALLLAYQKWRNEKEARRRKRAEAMKKVLVETVIKKKESKWRKIVNYFFGEREE